MLVENNIQVLTRHKCFLICGRVSILMKTGCQLLSWSALCNGEVWKNKDCKDWLTDFDFTSLFTQSPVSQDEMRSRSEPALLASAAIAAKERKDGQPPLGRLEPISWTFVVRGRGKLSQVILSLICKKLKMSGNQIQKCKCFFSKPSSVQEPKIVISRGFSSSHRWITHWDDQACSSYGQNKPQIYHCSPLPWQDQLLS